MESKKILKCHLAVRTRAWGCKCPDNYIGVGVNVKEGPWVYIESKKPLPSPDEIGYSLIVTGYFTGETKNLDLRDNDKEPEEWNYMIPVFKVTGWKKNTKGYNVSAPQVNGKVIY